MSTEKDNRVFRWMIFQPEGYDVLYYWNGKLPVVVHVAEHEGEIKDYLWPLTQQGDLPEKDIFELNQVNESSKRIFTVKSRGKRRYAVISRGCYTYHKTD